MKFSKYIIGGLACAMSLTSCNDWLDINVNPNSPTDNDATYYQRLPFMEFYTNSAYQFGAMRTNMGCGDWTMNSRTSTYGAYSQWEMTTGPVTTSYQWWFCGAGANIAKAIEKGIEAEAWHYVGAAYLIKAYGFMLMTDLYGEMPYTEALSITNMPKYDTGKTIFKGCLADIDLAIEYLQKTQGASAQPLSTGDYWAKGDVNKWIKMAYLLKARWLNHLIKKGKGSAADLKWDPTEILACLDKAMQSNDDNVIIYHTDDNSTTHDVLGWNEPVDYSPLYSVIGMNSNYYVTKMLTDNFTNFGGFNVEDPRADKIIPWCISQKSDDTPEGIVFKNGWRRSEGVDMNSTIRTSGAPYSTSWYNASKDMDDNFAKLKKSILDYKPSKAPGYFCQSDTRQGDTIYIHQTSSSKGYADNRNLFYYLSGTKNLNENSAMSGSFYSRVSAPTFIATYHEACFIRAEVLMREGQKNAAFDAYKKGIAAHIELMRNKVNEWVAEDKSLAECPSFTPMEQSVIDNYLENGIGNASNITLGHILTQKHMAMMFSIEQYNDMRRYDYAEDMFLNWHVPAEYYINATAQAQLEGKGIRRWRQCSHELNYNSDNLHAIGAEVPGANMSLSNWNGATNVWSIPVWWDSDQE